MTLEVDQTLNSVKRRHSKFSRRKLCFSDQTDYSVKTSLFTYKIKKFELFEDWDLYKEFKVLFGIFLGVQAAYYCKMKSMWFCGS